MDKVEDIGIDEENTQGGSGGRPLKKKKKTIKDRQLGRIKRYVPGIDENEIKDLLDDTLENREELRLAVVEQDKDPKEVFNNPIFTKRLIKYINEFKEETVDDINDTIEEAKEEINEAVDDILEDKKVELLEIMLNKFEMLVELMSSKVEDLDKIKDKYDEMVEDIENKLVEKKELSNPAILAGLERMENNKDLSLLPPGLARMLQIK